MTKAPVDTPASHLLRTLRVAPYFEPAWCYGGPVVSIPAACRALVEAGIDVTVFTTTANGEGELDVRTGEEVIRDGLRIRYFPRRAPGGYFRSPALAQALEEHARDFDLMHLHGVFCYTNWAAARIARRHGMPYVVTLHGTLDPRALGQHALKKRIYMQLVERRVLGGASRLIALTETEREQIEAMGFGPPVAVIPNGLDRRQFSNPPPREHVDERYPQVRGHPYVLYLSRLHPQKGLYLLIEAFAQFHGQHPNCRLIAAGPDEGGYRARIEAQVVQLGLTEAVSIVEPVTGEAKLALLSHCDLFCLPSYGEGLSTAIVEAMFCARPVLITDACHMPVVRQGNAGSIVPPEARALAQGLAELASMSADERRAMGERGCGIALREFEAAGVAERTRRLYQDILREARR